jgi:hypothetical protein
MVAFTTGYRKDMAAVKSEKEARLNYTNQPFARQLFVTILYVQLLAANDWHVFFSMKSL